MTPDNFFCLCLKTENSEGQIGVNFQEKAERLQEILFGPKDYAKDDEIPIKGTYIFIIVYISLHSA